MPEDFEQLHHLPDPVPGEDMHYKSFEDLYGTQTTEVHRPSIKDAKSKGKMKITRAKHTMPFCPSAARAKNVGITVSCAECEKPRLLFSAKKLAEKDKAVLQSFLDTIIYTCGMPFHNTCDLATAIPPKQSDVDMDNEVSHDKEVNDQEIMDEEDDSNENEHEPEDLDNEEEESDNNDKESEDSVHEIFSRVFVNDSWSCASQVEKPYYSTGIYPDVCIECGSLDVISVAKGEHPHCCGCSGNANASKKRLRWKQGGNDKGKRKA